MHGREGLHACRRSRVGVRLRRFPLREVAFAGLEDKPPLNGNGNIIPWIYLGKTQAYTTLQCEQQRKTAEIVPQTLTRSYGFAGFRYLCLRISRQAQYSKLPHDFKRCFVCVRCAYLRLTFFPGVCTCVVPSAGDELPAVTASLLFAVHPVHVEVSFLSRN